MAHQLQLFDSDNSHFPRPIDGESLYSWCVRFHRLSVNINAKLTSKQLFDNFTVGFRHDFPTRLSKLSENSNRLLGSVEELVYGRTVFSIFAPFLSQAAIEDVIQNMQNGVHSRIAYRIGLRGSPISTAAPLKACIQCMQEDKRLMGTAWWHIEHQFPTVRICSKHGTYLLMATQAFHSRGPQDWYFPTDIPQSSWHDMPPPDNLAMTRLRKLNDWSLWVSNFYDRPFDPYLLRLTYRLRAKSMGWSSNGALKFNHLRLAFRNIYACLEELPGFSYIKDTIHDHGGFLGAMLLNIGINKHPLRNLLLMDFLFDDPKTFITEYELVHSRSLRLNNAELWPELIDSESLLKMLVTEAGCTVNTAARQLHIPVKIAIRSLKNDGIEFKQDRSLDPKVEDNMIAYLLGGESLDEIATQLNIRRDRIINYLEKKPELQNNWRQSVENRNIEKHRSIFIQFLADNPSLSVNNIRMIPESGFRWLKSNDADWLERNLPGLWKHSSPKVKEEI